MNQSVSGVSSSAPNRYRQVNWQNRIGVLVEFKCEDAYTIKTKEFLAYAHELALHIAASSNSELPLVRQPFFRDRDKTVHDQFSKICEVLGVRISVPRYECYIIDESI